MFNSVNEFENGRILKHRGIVCDVLVMLSSGRDS